MNSFFYLLCNPIFLFGIMLAASAVFKFFKKGRTSIFFLGSAIFWLFLVSSTPFSQWVVFTLEKQYTTLSPKSIHGDSTVHILVLGGGHSIAPDLPAGSQLSSPAMIRLTEAIRIYRQIPGSKIVCSGYSSSGRVTQAEMISQAAVDLGVKETDTLQSRLPWNTAEEIRAYKKRFGDSTTLIVVTSASHMPRAMILCEMQGLKAIAAPTDFYIKKDPLKGSFDFQPYVLKILMLENALHEYAGLLKTKWID